MTSYVQDGGHDVRPRICSRVCWLPTSQPHACDVIGSLYVLQFLVHSTFVLICTISWACVMDVSVSNTCWSSSSSPAVVVVSATGSSGSCGSSRLADWIISDASSWEYCSARVPTTSRITVSRMCRQTSALFSSVSTLSISQGIKSFSTSGKPKKQLYFTPYAAGLLFNWKTHLPHKNNSCIG